MTYKIETFAKEVKQRAKRLNVSMNQVCKEAGISTSTFQRWLNGQGDALISTINKVAAVLDRKEGK